jgi:hypothetical protein
LTPNPIHKVLLTMRSHHVQSLLMGGQACVLYGAAEFSRDTDLALLSERENLAYLQQALDELRADCIAVPPLSEQYLNQGHAIHFRCHHPEAQGMRVDVMSVMRGVAPFEELWSRRTTLELDSGEVFELLSLPDLVRAKKTQRDKDWPMIRRLVEAHFFENRSHPTSEQIVFWLRESRTPSMLITLAQQFPDRVLEAVAQRALLESALDGNEAQLAEKLDQEEKQERELDRLYWLPLKRELEKLRHK